MAPSLRSVYRKAWQTLSSIKTGVILIILVVIFSVAGTVILQRPMTDPDDMQRAYSPVMLGFLDATGLTDVFHAPWFLALVVLVSLSIIAASVQRFPMPGGTSPGLTRARTKTSVEPYSRRRRFRSATRSEA